MDPDFWRTRYAEQAGWTRHLRQHIFTIAGLAQARRILDVGCGPGVLTEEVEGQVAAQMVGIDRDLSMLDYANRQRKAARYAAGDALALPFVSGLFDIVYCHYLLLWVREPVQAIKEMRRVTRPGGYVLALAEPDFGGRIDYPDDLAGHGKLQREALGQQGADPLVGRKLGALFLEAGFSDANVGVMGGEWRFPSQQDDGSVECRMLAHDLERLLPADELAQVEAKARKTWDRGMWLIFVPTFYGWAKKE